MNMNYQPKISVVTISYNIVTSIEKTILSVINQTYPNIEYIIIDGGSTDGTLDIIKKYSDKINYWISEPDKGIYDAMNKGIHIATGEWINFMNAGDIFYDNNVINETFSLIDENSFDIIYGDLVIDSPFGLYWKRADDLNNISKRMVFGHQASFINSKYHKSNEYDITFKSSGDYNFFYKAYFNNAKFKYIPIKVAIFDGKSGMSKDNFYIANLEDLRIYGKDKYLKNRVKLSFNFLLWKIKRFIKTIIGKKILTTLMKKKMEKNGYIAI